MGNLQAQEMVTWAGKETALLWHLRSNHFPPIHLDFLPVAKEAIDRANREDYNSIIDMPNSKSLPVWKIIEGMHLEAFLDEE